MKLLSIMLLLFTLGCATITYQEAYDRCMASPSTRNSDDTPPPPHIQKLRSDLKKVSCRLRASSESRSPFQPASIPYSTEVVIVDPFFLMPPLGYIPPPFIPTYTPPYRPPYDPSTSSRY